MGLEMDVLKDGILSNNLPCKHFNCGLIDILEAKNR